MSEYIYEISREPVKGVIGLIVILEVVYWLVSIAYVIYKWIRGKQVAVRQTRQEWRHRTRKRYETLATYRPEMDNRHPNYRGRR